MNKTIQHFSERLTEGLRLELDGRLLACGESPFQRWEVLETAAFGRLYRLDGRAMASEGDGFLCHEPLVHVAGLNHPGPHRALVLGGGDGASCAELLRYPTLCEIVMAELDPAVPRLARDWLPGLHGGALDDPSLRIVFGDAADYVRACTDTLAFDLIVFDLTDPDTAAAPLFTADFFRACRRLLAPQGALSLHLGSPLWQRTQCLELLARLRAVFAQVTPVFPLIPLYGGVWSLAVAGDGPDPTRLATEALASRLAGLHGPLRLINANQYHALLACPPWLAAFAS